MKIRIDSILCEQDKLLKTSNAFFEIIESKRITPIDFVSKTEKFSEETQRIEARKQKPKEELKKLVKLPFKLGITKRDAIEIDHIKKNILAFQRKVYF